METSKPYLVLETHFDNPEGTSGTIDNSGIRIYYTDTARQYEAGSLLIGDPLIARFDQIVKSGFLYQHSCPSECTSRMSKPINMFGSFMHMHTTGKQIYANIYNSDNTFVRNFNKVRARTEKQCTIFNVLETLFYLEFRLRYSFLHLFFEIALSSTDICNRN